MSYVIRNIDNLRKVESIKGKTISSTNIAFLIHFAKSHQISSIEVPLAPHQFSKPKRFFINHQKNKFCYLVNGKLVPFDDIDSKGKDFLAFKVRNHTLFLYGYFQGEQD